MKRLLGLSTALVAASAALCRHEWTVRDHVVDYMTPQRTVTTNTPVPESVRLPAQLVNREYPGPLLECNAGDDVEVLMINHLLDQGVSIHWHGMWMAGEGWKPEDSTPWSDGVHHITQAAIQPGGNYTYKFKAWPPGTHFWHSHMDSLQVDRGIKGPIVIHDPKDPYLDMYDEEIIVAMSDARRIPDVCMKLEGQEVDVGNPVCNEIDKTSWNGVYGNGSAAYPYPLITIEQGKCYRLRWIAMAGNTQNYQIRIAGHNMTIIALDSFNIIPYPVAGFNLHNGERVDAIICGDQKPGNYLINATYDLACELVNDPVFSPLPPVDSCLFYAFINYKGHTEIPKNIDPSRPGGWPQGTGGGLNPRNITGNFLDMNTNADGYQRVQNTFSTETPLKADYTYTIVGGILGPTPTQEGVSDAPLSGSGRTYLNTQVNKDPDSWSFSPHIPTDPVLHTKAQCGTNNAPMLNIPEDAKVVEIVLINTTPSAHVFHLHGMSFDVVNYGYPEWCDYAHHDACFFMLPKEGKENCEGELTWSDPDHKPMGGYLYWGCSYNASSPAQTKTANYKTPLRKDMISLWRRQWAVIRIYPKNPGMWILHCHMEQHIPTGMIIILNVLPSQQKPVPLDVPTSGNCPRPGHATKELIVRAPAQSSSPNAIKFNLTSYDWIVDYLRPTAIPELRKWPVKIPEASRQASIMFNGAFPSPVLQVNLGDDVEVTVNNNCLGDVTSIHWHGLAQAGTPWADGSVGVTMAAQLPTVKFTYKFKAQPAGTHYFHSQADGLQVMRGAKGAFIVQNPNDPHKALYQAEHIVEISDSWREPEVCFNRNVEDNVNNPDCALIDKASFSGQFGNGTKDYPYKTYAVKAGSCYRMRFIGMMSAVPSFTIAVAAHTLTIIAVDGSDVTPQDVSSFTIYAGERIDAVLCANQKSANFDITATYAAGCDPALQALYPSAPKATVCSFKATLAYDGSKPLEASTGVDVVDYGKRFHTGKIVDHSQSTQPVLMHLDLATAAGHAMLTPMVLAKPLPLTADAQIVLNLGYLDSSFSGAMYLYTSNTPWVKPTTPLLITKGKCGAEKTPVVNVPETATSIELVINNLTPEEHQVHLHGAHASVVEVGSYQWCEGSKMAACLAMSSAMGAGVCNSVVKSDPATPALDQWWGCTYSAAMNHAQNLDTPLIKDTFSLPRRGYVVLRVDTTIPGVWMLQTVQAAPQLRGATTALNVLPSKQAPVPADVPTEGPCK